MIYLRRGEEWASIQPLDEEDVLWLYGEGKVGNGRSLPCDCDRAVMSSQIAAHISKGWQIVFSLEDN